MTSVVDADGQRTEFVHHIGGRTEIVVDRLGHTNTFVYDERGNVTAITNALGGVSLMAYDDWGHKTNEVVFLNGAPYATNCYGLFSHRKNGRSDVAWHWSRRCRGAKGD